MHIDPGRLWCFRLWSGMRWTEEGKSSSAYFFQLERKWPTDGDILALSVSDVSMVVDKDCLCTFFRSFYLELFTTVPCLSSARVELLSRISLVLPFYDSETCEGLLSQGECFASLQCMACCWAPGFNGQPIEFYLKFWHVLGNDVVLVLKSALHSGSLSHSMHRGIITLAFKKEDHAEPNNWQTITLLNADHKIASCFLHFPK